VGVFFSEHSVHNTSPVHQNDQCHTADNISHYQPYKSIS